MPLPATVVTTPSGEMVRMRALDVSVTNTVPLALTATPCTSEKVAAAPVPSWLPAEPPASVLTTAPGIVTLRMAEF